MYARTKITTFALTLAIVPSLLLAGCGEQPAATGTTDTSAQQQFLEERAGTPDPNFTPVPGTDGVQFFGGGPDGQAGVAGTVQKVEGRDITISKLLDGSTKTVHLADDVKVTTQAEAKLADLKVGDSITAVGKLDGDKLTANMVQIGGGGFFSTTNVAAPGGKGGGSVSGGGSPGQAPDGSGSNDTFGPTPGTGGDTTFGPGAGGSEMPQMSTGTVDKIDGQSITIKGQDGKSITVLVSNTTTLQKEAEMDPSEIESGMTLTATGEQKGDVFEATSARIVPAMQMVTR